MGPVLSTYTIFGLILICSGVCRVQTARSGSWPLKAVYNEPGPLAWRVTGSTFTKTHQGTPSPQNIQGSVNAAFILCMQMKIVFMALYAFCVFNWG